MKYLILVAAVILMSGCSTSPSELRYEQQKGELRRELFVECMELASQNGRKGDDDVSDIVNACNNHSLYLANSMMPKP